MNNLRIAFASSIVTCFCSFPFPAGAMTDSGFATLDSNHDQRVSPDEHARGARAMFKAMDANHDGKVTAAEMQAASERTRGAKPDGSKMSAAGKIKVVDADGDGVLTVAEHSAGSRAMFTRMDTDRDGFLSAAEFEAGHAMLKPPAR